MTSPQNNWCVAFFVQWPSPSRSPPKCGHTPISLYWISAILSAPPRYNKGALAIREKGYKATRLHTRFGLASQKFPAMSSYPSYVIHRRLSEDSSSSAGSNSSTRRVPPLAFPQSSPTISQLSPSRSTRDESESCYVSPRTGRVIYGPPLSSRANEGINTRRIPSRSATVPVHTSYPDDQLNYSLAHARPPPTRSSTVSAAWPLPNAPHHLTEMPSPPNIYADRAIHRAPSALSMSSVSTDATLVAPASTIYEERHNRHTDTPELVPVSLSIEKRTRSSCPATHCVWALTWPAGNDYTALYLQQVAEGRFASVPKSATCKHNEPLPGLVSWPCVANMHHFALGSLDRRGRYALEAIATSLAAENEYTRADHIAWIRRVLDLAVERGLFDAGTVEWAMAHGRATLT